VPVKLDGASSGEELAEILSRSPRFDVRGAGLLLRITGRASACLGSPDGQVFDCVEGSDPADAARKLQREAFAPRVGLERIGIDSLEGGPGVSRDPLGPLLDADLCGVSRGRLRAPRRARRSGTSSGRSHSLPFTDPSRSTEEEAVSYAQHSGP